jgi:Raf kinase inhibitor-like YbhB/YbcL family protein
VVAALVLAGCGGGEKASKPLPSVAGSLTLKSSAFTDGATIPRRYTCSGDGVSPPLSWSGVPRAARELALVVEDQDAGRFLHWTVLGIRPSEAGFAEGRAPAGAVETENSFGRRGWGAPCPPHGDAPHRYVFALYALRAPSGLDASAPPDQVREELAAEALARGTLTGRFGRD